MQFFIIFSLQNYRQITNRKISMASNTTFLDQFIDKMYLVPNDINRYLRLIRTLDKKAELVQQSLNQSQIKFLSQLRQFKQSSGSGSNVANSTSSVSNNKKNMINGGFSEIPQSLKAQYEKILTKQKELYGYFKQKSDVAQQLKVIVTQYYETLDSQLKNKLSEKTEDEKDMFNNRKKQGSKFINASIVGVAQPNLQINSTMGSKLMTTGNLYLPQQLNSLGQFTYDAKEPAYCYCGRGSYGQMVACQNPYCQREWFHIECLQEKNLPQKWYCGECQKQRERTKNLHSRGFFVNRDNQSRS